MIIKEKFLAAMGYVSLKIQIVIILIESICGCVKNEISPQLRNWRTQKWAIPSSLFIYLLSNCKELTSDWKTERMNPQRSEQNDTVTPNFQDFLIKFFLHSNEARVRFRRSSFRNIIRLIAKYTG